MLKSKGIITNLQREILLISSQIPMIKMFYLTGGTALANFFLGHRKSYDLDIFTVETNELVRILQLLGKFLKIGLLYFKNS